MAKILIGCEFTGITRDAFNRLGHNATSCDLLPSETPGKHYQGDLLDILYDGWDLLIAHPPCTFLTFAGNAYWNEKGRASKRIEALSFFLKLWEAPIKYICLENPLGIIDSVIAKHDQLIHPYYFGDEQLKRTCLWLKNLPKLNYNLQPDLFNVQTATNYPKPKYISKNNKKLYYTESNYKANERNKTFNSIAEAMANQWTEFIKTQTYTDHDKNKNLKTKI